MGGPSLLGSPSKRPCPFGLLAIPPASANFPYMIAPNFRVQAAVRARSCAIALLCSSGITAGVQAQGGGITHVDTVEAHSLKGNLLGDSDRRAVTVYLPPSYSQKRLKRYPVVYLLHGFAADHRAFMRGAYQNLNVRISMDSLIRAGAVKEMIVVTPNARNAYDGSFYANSPVTGNWEDFVARDLVSYMDGHYRTIRNRSGRGISGHSMGGFGAIRVGMSHPETFSAIYAMSACCLTTGGPLAPRSVMPWKIVLGLTDRSQIPGAGFYANIDYALSAVYSPNPSRPPFFVDFPYRLEGDSLVSDGNVAPRWSKSPMTMVSSHAANLRRMAIAFDAGTADPFRDIPANVSKLDSLLIQLGVPHSAELYEGTHGSGIRARLETKAFPFFSRMLH